jgi:hypothetical protein
VSKQTYIRVTGTDVAFAEMKIGRHHCDIYSATVPLFYVMKILGFAPFVLEGELGDRRLRCSAISTAYVLAVSITFTYFRCVALRGFVRAMIGAEMLSTVVCVWGTCYIFFNIFLSFLGVLNSFKAAAILNILSQFDRAVGGMSYICFRSVLYICIQLCFPFFYCAYFCALLLCKRHFDVIQKFIISVDVIMIVCFNITQSNIMLLLKQRFRFLNVKLLELIHDRPNKNIKNVSHKRSSKGEKLSSKMLLLHEARIPKQHLKSQLLTLSSLHDHLCDASDQFNFFYSLQTLLCVAISFIELTVNAYIAFLNLIGVKIVIRQDDWAHHMTMLETYCHVTNVWAIAWSGTTAAHQVRERLQ